MNGQTAAACGYRKIRHKHGEGPSIDFYAYHSRIRSWNATFKVTLTFLTLILCIVLDDPKVSAAVIVAMTTLTVVFGGLPWSSYMRILTIPVTFILLGTIAIGIDFSTEPMGDFYMNLGFFYIFTSWMRLKMMLFLILKVFGAISAMEAMALSTPASEIIGVLRRARVPKLIAELMHMMYRYIFILLDVNINMRNSADSRLGFCDLKTSWSTFGKVAGNMLIVSLKRANTYFNAMEARCYDGEFRVLEEYGKINGVQIAGAIFFFGILIIIRMLGPGGTI